MAEEQTNPTPDEEVQESKVLEIPLEAASETPPETRPVPKARGKRGPDKKPRAKPKPKARVVRESALREETARGASRYVESSEEESADEATLQELHSLNLIRSIRAYDSQRHVRKQQLYASWFGR